MSGMIVEVFKTSIDCAAVAKDIEALLQARFPEMTVRFDLDDRDNIYPLRC